MKTGGPMLVKSQVKEEVQKHEMRSGEEFMVRLEEVIVGLIKHAAARAKANGRKTLTAHDL
jgi:histone H3/H4